MQSSSITRPNTPKHSFLSWYLVKGCNWETRRHYENQLKALACLASANGTAGAQCPPQNFASREEALCGVLDIADLWIKPVAWQFVSVRSYTRTENSGTTQIQSRTRWVKITRPQDMLGHKYLINTTHSSEASHPQPQGHQAVPAKFEWYPLTFFTNKSLGYLNDVWADYRSEDCGSNTSPTGQESPSHLAPIQTKTGAYSISQDEFAFCASAYYLFDMKTGFMVDLWIGRKFTYKGEAYYACIDKKDRNNVLSTQSISDSLLFWKFKKCTPTGTGVGT